MKTLFQYIAGIVYLTLCGLGVIALAALLILLSPIISLFVLVNE